MASIRQAAQDILSEARDSIAWIAVWKGGKGWMTMDFWPDMVSDNAAPVFDDDEMEQLQNIVKVDPAAVIVNAYYHNLGSTEEMTRDTLANALRWHYERGTELISAYLNSEESPTEEVRAVCNISGGKDSLAQGLYIIENGIPCDEFVFYDTGMEFGAIYRIFDKLQPILASKGIKLTILRPKKTFYYSMFEEPHTSRKDGVTRYGYGWCGGPCRWGTHEKLEALDRYAEGATQYIGIAADEQHRRAELTGTKTSLLIRLGMTEADCLQYCRDRGWDWIEETPATESGTIDLYDILDRVSCWCCCNKNMKELMNIRKYLPQYWERLKQLQEQLDRPMKRWKNKRFGEYGNVFRMEEVFAEMEDEK